MLANQFMVTDAPQLVYLTFREQLKSKNEETVALRKELTLKNEEIEKFKEFFGVLKHNYEARADHNNTIEEMVEHTDTIEEMSSKNLDLQAFLRIWGLTEQDANQFCTEMDICSTQDFKKLEDIDWEEGGDVAAIPFVSALTKEYILWLKDTLNGNIRILNPDIVKEMVKKWRQKVEGAYCLPVQQFRNVLLDLQYNSKRQLAEATASRHDGDPARPVTTGGYSSKYSN